ncbi:hypothetical protein EVAR_66332_1 [Eumeta japonica]|uniref:Helitron helicase-like domain-containing protein n=1 Tax=Eumeta variegata TaxID=151549 RepID=A0A4C1YZN2_EUMVA|nr:hypothetical protein EVAR_66332_1 [Eumeta japonica]
MKFIEAGRSRPGLDRPWRVAGERRGAGARFMRRPYRRRLEGTISRGPPHAHRTRYAQVVPLHFSNILLILHYFKRIEFQHRGSPHAHILAWLDNAPEDALNKDYNKAIDLIDFLISVSAAEASGDIRLQTHKHTFTCYKGIASRRQQKCRFEAPFMPVKKTMILTPMPDTENGFQQYKAKYS